MMEISVSKEVLPSKKLKRRNFTSKNIKERKNVKNEQLRIASDDVPLNSELGSKNASGWSSPKGFKNCF